jgi:hypothetical protein
VESVVLSYLQYVVQIALQLGLLGVPFLCLVVLLEIALQQRIQLGNGELWKMKLCSFTVLS